MKKKTMSIFILIIISIAALFVACGDPTITYNLDGGVNHPDNPAEYGGGGNRIKRPNKGRLCI